MLCHQMVFSYVVFVIAADILVIIVDVDLDAGGVVVEGGLDGRRKGRWLKLVGGFILTVKVNNYEVS